MKDFEINIKDSYPKIITPNYLKFASNSEIRFDEIYPNTKKPSFTNLKTEDNDLKIVGAGIVNGFVIFTGVGFFCLFLTNFISVSTETWKAYWVPPILLCGIIGGVRIIILGFMEREKDHEIIRQGNKTNYDKYIIELEKFNKLLKSVSSIEFQNKEKLKRCLKDSENNKKSIFKSLEILEDGTIKKGISEEFFHKFLVSYSDFRVYKSIKFSFYYPDLILVKNDLVIALEIDEPYSFDSKEPIHYENSDKGRDDYFVSCGFILIRFTEDQILSNTEKCLALINEVVTSCLDLKNYTKSLAYLQLEKKPWTHEEAFNFAYKNSRIGIPAQIQVLEKKYSLSRF